MAWSIQDVHFEGGYQEPDHLGYNIHDFFEPSDVLHQTFNSEEEAEAAAQNAYLGADQDGVGVVWEIRRTVDFRDDVFRAESLTELCEALNNLYQYADPDGTDRMRDYVRFLDTRMGEVPTFGNQPPADTSGVFSWDDRYLLVRADNSGFAIAERDDV